MSTFTFLIMFLFPNDKPTSWFCKLCIFALCFTVCFKQTLSCDKPKILSLPALGRISELGKIYDATEEDFRPVNLFNTIPHDDNKIIATTQKQLNTNIRKSTTTTLEQTFKDIGIDSITAVNILTSSVQMNGSVQFLNEFRKNLNEISGVMLYTFETVSQELQIYSKSLKPFYNMDLLHHKGTHIVTGITWGARVAVILRKPVTEKDNIEEIKNLLRSELAMLNELTSPSLKNKKSNFAIEIFADIPFDVPFQKPLTHGNVQEILQNLPQFIQNVNGGKGVPIYYSLTPLRLIHEFFEFQSEYKTVVCEINDLVLTNIIHTLREIEALKLKIKDLEQNILKEINCLKEQVVINATELSTAFLVAEAKYRKEVRDTVVCAKEGICNVSTIPISFTHSEFKQIQEQHAKFKYVMKKLDIWKANQKPHLACTCESNKTVAQILNDAADVRNLDCGGLVNLPINGYVFLKYKSSGNPGDKKRCLWTLHSNIGRKYFNKIRISLLCDKVGNSNDTITFYQWIPEVSNLLFYDLRTSIGQELSSDYDDWICRNYLYFFTKGVLAGAEFIIRIDVVESRHWGTEINWHFDKATGSASYPGYQSDLSTSIAIVPPIRSIGPIRFKLEFWHKSENNNHCGNSHEKNNNCGNVHENIHKYCSNYESLDVYEFGERGEPRKLARVCSEHNYASFCTIHPVIAVFHYPIVYESDMIYPNNYKISWC